MCASVSVCADFLLQSSSPHFCFSNLPTHWQQHQSLAQSDSSRAVWLLDWLPVWVLETHHFSNKSLYFLLFVPAELTLGKLFFEKGRKQVFLKNNKGFICYLHFSIQFIKCLLNIQYASGTVTYIRDKRTFPTCIQYFLSYTCDGHKGYTILPILHKVALTKAVPRFRNNVGSSIKFTQCDTIIFSWQILNGFQRLVTFSYLLSNH